MRKNQILSKVRRKKKIYQWCGFTGVTYLLFGKPTLYLSTIMKAFNREIISYVISESQALPLAMKTLKKAMRGRNVKDVFFFTQIREVFI